MMLPLCSPCKILPTFLPFSSMLRGWRKITLRIGLLQLHNLVTNLPPSFSTFPYFSQELIQNFSTFTKPSFPSFLGNQFTFYPEKKRRRKFHKYSFHFPLSFIPTPIFLLNSLEGSLLQPRDNLITFVLDEIESFLPP